ncbi:GlxA family transcriptional regulator [Shimia sediminis]|uniref:GlxA family transcriptional regulator n=1 Tax=Shimia sediminis TaxID=2497945 RepID=UPI000F8D41DD|nr:helix-turn-helix domain-containing protein [Shimia sediminis]
MTQSAPMSRKTAPGPTPVTFEVFIQSGFSELELASILTVLKTADSLSKSHSFGWRVVSDAPGFVTGACGTIARAEPAIFDHALADVMLVIGGDSCDPKGWQFRVRAMQRHRRPVAVLSEAATAYIEAIKAYDLPVTTHWRDITRLNEEGTYSALATTYVQTSSGVMTCAGVGFAPELVLNLLSAYLSRNEIAELASHLQIETIRDTSAEQPKGASFLTNMFTPLMEQAVRIMEDNLAEPLPTTEVSAELGVSIRQLERLFQTVLGTSPARYYKELRVKKAHILITGTKMPLIDVAIACGFGSTGTLSSAYKSHYGLSPKMVRTGGVLRR